jgi:prephenate dehydrogenase
VTQDAVNFPIKKLAIFGVGLIGGSVALALKKTGNAPEIVGVGRNADNLTTALKLGVIDSATDDIQLATQNADLIFIATPVAQIPNILEAILPHLSSKTIITDAGSTKCDVLHHAERILGAKSSQFVGGHPIAGAEKSGVTAAFAELYENKNIVLTPSANTKSEAVDIVTQFWQQCGGIVSKMAASAHDGIFAAVSHLPHLLAFALVDELASRENANQLFDFAASGFRDFTRIAGSHPEMWRDISLANKDALLDEITAYEAKLAHIKTLLKNTDSKALEVLFTRASVARNDWADSKKQ